jgi:4,4'-diaponeurosporenoate glycosyltransferase
MLESDVESDVSVVQSAVRLVAALADWLDMDLFALSMLVRWALGWWLQWRVPRLPEPAGSQRPDPAVDASTAGPWVSVVVPARNEAVSLPVLLEALAAQEPAVSQVVVVDDHSTDDTAALAAASGATVLAAPALPAGWTGKTWAAWCGAQSVLADEVVFLDADTRPQSDFVARLVQERRYRGGVVSVQPYHRMHRVGERLAAYFNVLSVMGSGIATPVAGHGHPVDVFGPAIAVARRDYLAVGGHQAVRGHVVEDRALGRLFGAHQLPVTAVGGRGVIDFRMYPDGWSGLAEGFTKNFFAGASGTPWWRLLLIVGWVSGVMVAAWTTVAGLLDWAVGGPAPTTLTLLYYVAFAAQTGWLLRPLGNFGLTWLVFPLPLAAFVVVFVRSLVAAIRGEVVWKGRRISQRSGPDPDAGPGPDPDPDPDADAGPGPGRVQ